MGELARSLRLTRIRIHLRHRIRGRVRVAEFEVIANRVVHPFHIAFILALAPLLPRALAPPLLNNLPLIHTLPQLLALALLPFFALTRPGPHAHPHLPAAPPQSRDLSLRVAPQALSRPPHQAVHDAGRGERASDGLWSPSLANHLARPGRTADAEGAVVPETEKETNSGAGGPGWGAGCCCAGAGAEGVIGSASRRW
ncbi:hypothetical protein M422DRAFT_273376 [Sphaerobolus stellatus SS14]|uniref:Uncharacterized protein n=1 Tax=Sphaerobolus stellatus (strain SS14) TaxID=990650 RepID=A0A0C9TUU4_SPHS4|nr:hypothetical protein M422DRAFT_273376 [Sphaerobolus stellatus SS14]